MTGQGNEGGEQPFRDFPQPRGGAGSGSIVMVIWEGTRPLLVELQALVDYSQLSNPRRVAVGMDHNRLAMLLAVLHRHGGLQMADQDVFINVVGGVKVEETSADLALLLAMVSSFRDQALPRIWWSLARWGSPARYGPCPRVRSDCRRRPSTVSAEPSSRMPMRPNIPSRGWRWCR